MEAWDNGATKKSLSSVASALKGIMESLHRWSCDKFGSVRKQLEELRSHLAGLKGMDDTSREEARKTATVMDELLYREEMMWLQRSHVLWL